MAIIELLDENFYEKNPLFTSTNMIIEFVKPLRKFKLSYFTFDRHYKDNSRISLTSAADWIRHYWQEKLYENSIFERDHSKFSDGYVLWSWLNQEPVYSTASLYGIVNGITIIEKHENYCDFLNFGSINDNTVNNNYLIENLPCLYQFIAFFKHRMKGLISDAEKHKIHLSLPPQHVRKIESSAEITGTNFCNFMDGRNVSRIYLGDEFENSYLTKKEFELMALLASGLNSSEAGVNLGISNDTVNKHIKNLKNKLNCKTLCELGFAMGRAGSRDIYKFKNLGL